MRNLEFSHNLHPFPLHKQAGESALFTVGKKDVYCIESH